MGADGKTKKKIRKFYRIEKTINAMEKNRANKEGRV